MSTAQTHSEVSRQTNQPIAPDDADAISSRSAEEFYRARWRLIWNEVCRKERDNPSIANVNIEFEILKLETNLANDVRLTLVPAKYATYKQEALLKARALARLRPKAADEEHVIESKVVKAAIQNYIEHNQDWLPQDDKLEEFKALQNANHSFMRSILQSPRK